MNDNQPADRKLEALAFALELMGFDAERLATAMLASGDPYWKLLSLRSVRVEFDHQRAHEVQPDLSVVAEAAAESWFADVRHHAQVGELLDSLATGHPGAWASTHAAAVPSAAKLAGEGAR